MKASKLALAPCSLAASGLQTAYLRLLLSGVVLWGAALIGIDGAHAQSKWGHFGAEPNAPASAPAAPAQAAPIASADNIVVKSGNTTIRIKHIEIAGSSLSEADVAALFDTNDAKILEARLRKLDAASIVIPEITGDAIDGTGRMHFAQQQILLVEVHGGRAATGSAAAGTLTFKDDKGDKDETKISTGAATFKGIDLAQIAHLVTGPRTDESEALQPLCDEFAVDTVTIGGALENVASATIATIRETGLKGRPLKPAVASDKNGGATSLDDIAHSFSTDLIEADNLALAGTLGAASKGLKSLALHHAAMRGLGGGRLARFELSDLAMEGNEKQPGTIKLGAVEIDNVASNATPVPSIDRIDLRDVLVDVPTEDKSGQRITLSVAHAKYAAPGLVIGKLPEKATLSIEHASFDVPPDSAVSPVLVAMGYKRLDLSSETVSRYDVAARTLDLDRLSLSGVGMGELDIKVELGNVTDAIVSQNDAIQTRAAAAMLVRSLDLKLRNEGLIDKAIGFKAAIDGVSVDQERTNIAQLVDTALVGFGLQDSAKAQLVVAALHSFIADPKTLHIALASKTGLGTDAISLIASPRALLDALDVEAGTP